MDIDRAARISALNEHPSFQELAVEVDGLVERYAASLARLMLRTGQPYDDFEYKRGYLAGLQAAVRYPEKATKELERDIARSKTQEV